MGYLDDPNTPERIKQGIRQGGGDTLPRGAGWALHNYETLLQGRGPGLRRNPNAQPGSDREDYWEVPDWRHMFDPVTGMPFSGQLPDEHISPMVQMRAEEWARWRQAQLMGRGQNVLRSQRNRLASYRPGGAADLMSPLAQMQAQGYWQQAANTQAPDLMFRYREWTEQKRQRAAEKEKTTRTAVTAAAVIAAVASAGIGAAALAGAAPAVAGGVGSIGAAAGMGGAFLGTTVGAGAGASLGGLALAGGLGALSSGLMNYGSTPGPNEIAAANAPTETFGMQAPTYAGPQGPNPAAMAPPGGPTPPGEIGAQPPGSDLGTMQAQGQGAPGAPDQMQGQDGQKTLSAQAQQQAGMGEPGAGGPGGMGGGPTGMGGGMGMGMGSPPPQSRAMHSGGPGGFDLTSSPGTVGRSFGGLPDDELYAIQWAIEDDTRPYSVGEMMNARLDQLVGSVLGSEGMGY